MAHVPSLAASVDVLDASFASDNSAGVAPEVAAALAAAGGGFCAAYGDDEASREAGRLLAEQFGPGIAAYFVGTGTAANVLAIGSLAQPGDQVLVASSAHAYNDEAGAIEALTRCAMRPLPHGAGKVEPDALRGALSRRLSVHESVPAILSLAQATELGTVYTPRELSELCAIAHDHGLLVHLDGARLANAAAALEVSLADVSFGCGVDALSLGTSKNGTMSGEVVLLRPNGRNGPAPAAIAARLHKQLGQLHSKQRYLAAQVAAVLRDECWRSNALTANAAARRLAQGLESIGATISYPVRANAVFATLDPETVARLRSRYLLLDGPAPGEVRFMTSYATTPARIEELLDIAAAGA
ncbi:MAG: threonine aldolase family protein [bacterium]